MAFTEDGTLRGDLVDSISAISSQTGSSITSNFRFAKGADTLSEALHFVEPAHHGCG